MVYPRIYLAIDNCFASKRWTKPTEWLKVIKDLGLNCVEASSDTECDPLYMDPVYLEDWVEEVGEQSGKNGVNVVNLYSGHGTYTTLGLTHTDIRIRDRFLNGWLKSFVRIAGKIGAGVGFYCHAFNDGMLQDIYEYSQIENELYDRLAELAEFAKVYGNMSIGVEQMYTPHQIPWTIEGSKKLIKEVYKRSKRPFYITIDTGHQTGQSRFLRPDTDKIREIYKNTCNNDNRPVIEGIWLGPKSCYEIFLKSREGKMKEKEFVKSIEYEMNMFSHMFSNTEDGDTYEWLKKLGCYSPIIHLQQTNGISSSHLPFTDENNNRGIITGDKILESLAASYQNDTEDGYPTKCDKIFLTLELFFSTAEISYNIIRDLESSVAYWRQFIPEDGLPLDRLMELRKSEPMAI